MNETFQSLFENVCRCFGHTATNGQPGGGIGESALPSAATPNTRNNNDNDINNNTDGQHQQQVITQVNSHVSSVSGKRRTNKLELNDKQYDELFVKAKQQHQRSTASSLSKIPPRPQGNNNDSRGDNETAQAVAQAKIAANPNRYRPKRKRSAQTREEIFRNKNKQQQQQQAANNGGQSSVRTGPGCGVGSNNNNNNGGKCGSSTKSSYTPQSDFSRLLNPSLALCFATPIRGTEEMDNIDNEQDVRSVDASDTATLNTNGEDTITSTLYFDSKYAHIQETRPPMPLFNQFKLGPAQDEIRTIMASDSHSSVRMVEIMQQNDQHQQQQKHYQQQQQTPVAKQRAVGKDESSMNVEEQKQQGRVGGRSNKDWGRSSPNRESVNNHNNSNQRTASTTSLSQSSSMSLRKKDTISTHNHGIDPPDEEMEDAVPDVKAVSSSTDSSRLSNTATRHASS
jgi:hypothetical protein